MIDRLKSLKNFLGDPVPDGLDYGWWIFPSAQNPRFLIPTEKKFWREGLAFVSSGKKRMALRCLLRIYRLVRRKPDLTFKGSFPAVLQRSLDVRVRHFAVYVSTPSRFSKYTLALLGPSAEPLGFAKLSEGKDADKAIEDEISALAFLAKEFPTSRSFPRIIDQQEGFAIQSPAPDSGHGGLPQNAGRIAATLFQARASEVSWVDSDSRKSFLETILELREAGQDDLSSLIEEMEKQLSTKLRNVPIREGLTHGDFVSWNMADAPEGFVFDWEWMRRRAEYHDFFHFLWIQELQAKESPGPSRLIAKLASREGQDFLKGYRSRTEDPLCKDAILYLASCFAFYSRHCVANDDDPLAFPFMIAILKNYRAFMDFDGLTPCLSLSNFKKTTP